MSVLELERAKSDAIHDHLTGLFNLRGLEEEFDRLSRDMPGNFSACYIDLDGLKEINDTYGHSAGNVLIRNAATVLSDSVRIKLQEEWVNGREKPSTEPDIVTAARIGGDEFVILLVGVSKQEQLDNILHRIRQDLDDVDISASLDGRPHQVGESSEVLLDKVDKLMAAKKAERKREEFNGLSRRKKIAGFIGKRLIRYAGVNPPR